MPCAAPDASPDAQTQKQLSAAAGLRPRTESAPLCPPLTHTRARLGLALYVTQNIQAVLHTPGRVYGDAAHASCVENVWSDSRFGLCVTPPLANSGRLPRLSLLALFATLAAVCTPAGRLRTKCKPAAPGLHFPWSLPPRLDAPAAFSPALPPGASAVIIAVAIFRNIWREQGPDVKQSCQDILSDIRSGCGDPQTSEGTRRLSRSALGRRGHSVAFRWNQICVAGQHALWFYTPPPPLLSGNSCSGL